MNISLWKELPGEWVCSGKTGTKFQYGNLAVQMATLLFEKCLPVAFLKIWELHFGFGTPSIPTPLEML
jgi:hypothetical protein